MTRPFRPSLRLKPSILTLFVLLTVPVLAAIIALNYVSNDRIARVKGQELVERFRGDAIDSIRAIFDPIKTMIRAAAVVGDEQPDFYADNRSIKYFYTILQHSPKIVSVYVGLTDGSFRQARRIDPKVPVNDALPPPGALFAYRWIERKAGEGLVDRYLFLDANGQGLGVSSGVTAYDPRNRMWFRDTVEAGGLFITDPDVFATLGLIGFTVGHSFSRDGEVQGVVAADITLEGLSEYIAEHKISPNALSYVLDQQGRVLSASDLSKTYTSEKGRVDLRHISQLDNELPAIAAARRSTLFIMVVENILPASARCRPTSARNGSSSSSRRSPISPAPSTATTSTCSRSAWRRRCWRSPSSMSWRALSPRRSSGWPPRSPGFRNCIPSRCPPCAARSGRSPCCPARSTRSTLQ
jgi:adenylate cyclase